MRLLLDESVPSRLRRALPKHSVRTVGEMGWSGFKNGKLLAFELLALLTLMPALEVQLSSLKPKAYVRIAAGA